MNELYFAEYLRAFRTNGKIALESAVIVRHGDGEEGEGDMFSTQLGDTSQGTEPSVLVRSSIAPGELDPRVLGLVYPLVKRPGNAFDYISVGRTANVDVTLPMLQISKFHAYFSKDRAGEYTLADGGSRNGTRVGSRRLDVRVPAPVKGGDNVRFGPYLFTFFLPSEFTALVAARAKLT